MRVEALGQVLTEAMASVKTSLDKQNGAVLGLFALVASLPVTADADLERVGAAIEAMTAGLTDQEKLRDEMAKTASRAVLLARRLRAEFSETGN